MADILKYVSLANLTKYDEKIKEHIATADDTLKSNLEGQVEVVAGALDSEIARAKAAEQANAASAQAAQTAVDTLAGKVGAVPDGKTVMGIIEQIQADAYDDTEVRGLISGLDTNKADKAQVATDIAAAVKVETDARVEAVAGVQSNVNTLSQTVASNKTAIEGTVSTLEAKVDANESDIEGKMTALTSRVAANETAVGTTLPNSIAEVKSTADAAKASIDAFLKEADATEAAIDTLKEIQAELAAGDAGAASMLASINQNASDIDALEAAVAKKAEQTALESEVTNRTNADDALSARITTLENAVGEGGSVAEDIDTAKQEAVNEAVATAAADATSKANAAEANAKAHATALDEAMGVRVATLETASATHALASDLTALTGRVTTVEGKVSTLETEMDAVETLAAAADAAAKANASAIALKASQADLEAVSGRVTTLETWHSNFVECSQEDINNLFA